MAGNEPEHLPAGQTPAPLSDLADDRAQLYDILTRAGLQGRDAHVFTKLVEDMASANLIHRFESKLEAQNAKLDALKDEVHSKYTHIQWTIGLGLGLIAAAGTVVAILSALT